MQHWFSLLASAATLYAVTPSLAVAKSLNASQVHLNPAFEISRIPVTATSKPFLAATDDLAAHGYVEEEYFVSGQARAYEWVGDTLKVRPASKAGPYVTRILVRRPIDPARFSGNIEFETLNSSTSLDITTTMATSADYVMDKGDVWIGVTSKSVTLNALKRFDPARYAPLAWSNPMPAEARCPHPSIVPMYPMAGMFKIEDFPAMPDAPSEDGLIWDIYGQIGAFLKGDQRERILPGFRRPHIFATGYSQSGMIQRNFISAFHNLMRMPDGGPIFDGYLVEVGPAMLRINQCSTDILPDDPRNHLPVIDVPVINIVSEGDMWLGLHTRQPDRVDGRTGLVTYEIAGASHKTGFGEAGHATKLEATRAGVPNPLIPVPKDIVVNDFPRGYLSAAALKNLQDWALKGTAPPQAPRLEIEAGKVVRDADGNALGGLRSPWIDVPLARYQGAVGLAAYAVVGQKFPYPHEKLRQLYPEHATYVGKVKTSVASAVDQRWLLPESGKRIIQAAEGVDVP
ncbi:alpha/beta hydrolase domain-containing protein [Sphingomonas solaris]|uniref:Alpha/beta hydrolase domain-containing protein n=1 Tax=Alterirhizorhabdus solaris TaxID=2529389 RepID=A0A558QRQ0_9SPHN|nr:alpha/beta hydrolase domain-containing protein [Sphingomonas solaris]TVV69816.1 hypothetical protein FOY91_20740 [Sphingomonas solaris]